MEFKGTKGKWDANGSIVYMDDNSKSIYPHYECGGFGIEKEANALLISKAPQMLDFLIELYKDKKTYLEMFPSQQKKLEQLIKEATEL